MNRTHTASHRVQVRTVVVQISRKLKATYRLRTGRLFSALLAALVAAFSPLARALPQGAELVGGQASVTTPTTNSMVVNQGSNKAILNWQSFNIGSGELVQFVQPGASSVALNRVSGGASTIAGALKANGQVFLVNPAGVLFAPGAEVNVGGLVASTLELSNTDFLNGRYQFSGGGLGSVTNQGSLAGRYVVLAGPTVSNSGTIDAQRGSVGLLAGSRVTVDPAGAGLVNFSVDAGAVNAAIANSGTITADGGKVAVLASSLTDTLPTVINQSGVIRANSIAERSGTIVLSGGPKGVARVSGTLEATGDEGEIGGTVKVLGDKVALAATSRISTSGDAGGGTVLVGGNWQGKGPEQNASHARMASGAKISADAINSGNGGTVVVWADGSTAVGGAISARGGANSGNGGRVETSGKESLVVAGTTTVDASAPRGKAGNWLLDPKNIVVAIGGAALQDAVDQFSDTPASTVTIAPATLDVAMADVFLRANNDITFQDAVSIAAANVGLSASAGRHVIVNANVTTNNGAINMVANDTALNGVVLANRDPGLGSVTVGAGRTINAGTGTVGLAVNTGSGAGTGGTIVLGGGGTQVVGGTVTVSNSQAGMDVAGGINASTMLSMQAAGDITIQNGAPLAAGNGGISISATGAVGLFDAVGAATTGSISILADTDANGTGVLSTGGVAPIGNASAGAVTLQGSNIAINSAVTGANVTLQASTDASTIGVGTGAPGTFVVSNPELNRISTAGLLRIGSATNTGGITAEGMTGGSKNIELVTAGTFTSSGASQSTTSGNLTITANAMTLGTIVSGANLTLRPTTGGQLINIGGADAAGTLGISSAELNFAHAQGGGTLTIGRNDGSASGTINITAPASFFGTDVVLRTAAGVTQTAGSTITVQNLAIAASGAVVLTEANNVSTLAISATGQAVSYTDVDALSIGNTLLGGIGITAGNPTIVAGGAITQTQAISASGTTTLNAGAANDITLGAANNFGTVSVTSGNNVTLNDTNGIDLGASTVSGNLAVSAAGNITDSGNLSVAGTTTVTPGAANSVVLNQAGNNFAGAVSVTNGTNVTLVDANALNLGPVAITGSLAATATAGDITNTGGALTIGGNSTFTANALGASILVNNAGNNFTGTVAFAGAAGLANVSVSDTSALDLQALTLSGNLSVTAAGITDSGSLVAGGTTTLTAGAGNNITLDNANNFSTVSVVSGNNVTLNDVNGINLGASTVSGNLAVTAAGAITDSGALSVTGATTLTAGGANDITLDNANNFIGAVSVVSGNDVTLNDINAIDLGASTVSGNLAVTAAGAITDSGALGVSGTTTLTAGATNDITLNNANNFSWVSVVSGNNVTLNDVTGIGLAGATAATLNVTAGGAITQTAALNVGTLSGSAGTSATLTNAGNQVGVLNGFTAANGFSLVDGAGGLTVAGTVSGGAGATTISTIDSLDLTGIVAGTGVSVTGTGVTQAAGSTINGAFSDVVVDGNDGVINMAGTITTGSSSATAVQILDATTTTLGNIFTANNGTVRLGTAGADSLNGAVTQTLGTAINTGTLTVAAATTVNLGNANTVSNLGPTISNGGFTFNDAGGGLAISGGVSDSSGPMSITTADGNLAVNNTVTGTGVTLAANGAGSNIALGANVVAGTGTATLTADTAITRTAGTVSGNAVSLTTTSGSIVADVAATTLTGSAGTSATITGDVTTLNGFTTGSGFSMADVNALTVAGAINGGTGGVTLTANGGTLTLQAAGDISAGGTVNLTGSTGISTAGDVTTTNAAVNYNSATTLTGAVAVSTGSGAVTFGQVTGGGNNLSLAATGGVTAGAISGVNLLTTGAGTDVTATSVAATTAILGGNVTTSGTQAYAATTLTAPVTLSGSSLGLGNVYGNGNALSLVGNTGALDMTGIGILSTAVGTELSASSVQAAGANLGGNVTTTGAQTYAGPVTLAAAVAAQSTGNADIAFNGSIDGAHALTVTTSGLTTLAGPVGGTTPLASLVTNGGGTTVVAGNVTTTGAQTLEDVTLSGNAALTSTGNQAITLTNVTGGGNDLTLGSTGGATAGTIAGLGTLTLSAGTDLSATSVAAAGGNLAGDVTTTGSQSYTGPLQTAAGTTLTATGSLTATDAGNVIGSGTQFAIGSGTLDVAGDFAGAARVSGNATTVNLSDSSAATQLVITGMSAAPSANVTLVSAGAMQIDAAALSPVANLTATSGGDMMFLNSGTLQGGEPGVLATGALTLSASGALNSAADPLVINVATPVVNISASPAYTNQMLPPAPTPVPAPAPAPAVATSDALLRQAADIAGVLQAQVDELIATEVRNAAGLLRTERLVFLSNLSPSAVAAPLAFRGDVTIRLPRCVVAQLKEEPGCR